MIRLFSACALLCAFFISPAAAQNFLDGVVSINVNMTKEETCIASQYGIGGLHDRVSRGFRGSAQYGLASAGHHCETGNPGPSHRRGCTAACAATDARHRIVSLGDARVVMGTINRERHMRFAKTMRRAAVGRIRS
jgi:hypothetical protein